MNASPTAALDLAVIIEALASQARFFSRSTSRSIDRGR